MSLPPRFDDHTERILREARTELARLEEENRLVRSELNLVLSSRARRAFLRGRALASMVTLPVRHPIWSLRTAGRRLAGTTPSRLARAMLRQLERHILPLRLLPPVEREAGEQDPDRAIRWIGSVAVAGERHDALFCHADTAVVFRATVMPGSRIRCHASLSPETWAFSRGGAEFSLSASSSSGWADRAKVFVDPGRRWRDRRWVPVSLEIPEAAGREITVRLATQFPSGARAGSAWALWGDPAIEWPRNARDRRRLMRAFLSRLKTTGLRDAVAHVQRRQDEDQAAAYAAWVEAHALDEAALARLKDRVQRLAWQPLISVIVPVHNTPPDLLRACIESVRRQVYPCWEVCIADDASADGATVAALREYPDDERVRITRLPSNQHISLASNAALALARGEFVAFLDHDDELPREALAEVVQYLNAHPDVDLLYSDEDKLDASGARCDPAFKPAWSPDFFLTCMYTCHLMVLRRSLVEEVGGFRAGYEGAQDYDLVLRVMERTDRIHHIPKVLYHWRKTSQSTASAGLAKPWALDAGHRALEDYARRNQLDAEVLPGAAPGLYRLRRRIRGEPLVSVVIPTTGLPRVNSGREEDLLMRCLQSVRLKTTWRRYEIVLVIDREPRPALTEALAGISCRVVRYAATTPFNFSHKINEGVRQAAGEHVVLFNDDLEVISPEWLSAMLEHSQQPEVGAVGARLLYPDGRLQHAGMLIGVAGVAAHAYHQYPGTAPGYMSANACVRNCSAVTAACVMVRRSVWEEIGGFNEDFAIDFNDVDFCLRLRRAGYRIVYTPYAELYHHESASFGARMQNPRELARMRELWGTAVDVDPYYNPNLSREFPDYRIRL